MDEKPKIMIDTEGDISNRFKDAKVLVLGKDQIDTANIIKAVKESGAKIVVVDSYSEPKPDDNLKKLKEVEALACMSPWLAPAFEHIAKRYRKPPKPVRKYGLPGCEKMSERDYCCAEHCKEHRKRK